MRDNSEFKYKLLSLMGPLFGIGLSFLILFILGGIMGVGPGKIYEAISQFCFSAAGIGYIIAESIPLIFAGLAVSIAFQAGVFNIGVEGQYFIGGLVGAVIGIYAPMPSILHVPAVILASMAGGALWALIPALLKVWKGVHEVITTIMMNMISYSVALYFVNGSLSGLSQGMSIEPRTKMIADTAVMGKVHGLFKMFGLNFPDYVALDFSLIVALVAVIIAWVMLYKTKSGFEMRGVGVNKFAVEYGGVDAKKVMLTSFLLSGAVAGLTGLHEIFYIRKYYTFNIAHGLGFTGIAVALVGANNPLGVIPAALLLSFFKRAGYGLQLMTPLPNSAISAVTGAMILLIVICNVMVARFIRDLRRKEASRA